MKEEGEFYESFVWLGNIFLKNLWFGIELKEIFDRVREKDNRVCICVFILIICYVIIFFCFNFLFLGIV